MVTTALAKAEFVTHHSWKVFLFCCIALPPEPLTNLHVPRFVLMAENRPVYGPWDETPASAQAPVPLSGAAAAPMQRPSQSLGSFTGNMHQGAS